MNRNNFNAYIASQITFMTLIVLVFSMFVYLALWLGFPIALLPIVACAFLTSYFYSALKKLQFILSLRKEENIDQENDFNMENSIIAASCARKNAYTAAQCYIASDEFQSLLGIIYLAIKQKSLQGEGVCFFDFTSACLPLRRSPQLVANALQTTLIPLGYKLEFQNTVKAKGLIKKYKVLLFWGASQSEEDSKFVGKC